MYSFLHEIFSDKKGGLIFECFSPWHIAYIFLIFSVTAFILYYYRKKNDDEKCRITKLFADISFGMMIADFFIMPLAYGEIDIEKLPFHACTAMCVMSFLSYRVKFLAKYRVNFALLGFISNFVYLIYPAGVMWHQTHPISYRVIQTLIFHGLMSIFGLLVMVYEAEKNNFKKCYRDLTVTVCMTLWALLGNYVYNGNYGDKTHFFNWFFVVRDPFYMIPENIAPFLMPALNITIFFAVEMVIYLVIWKAKRTEK